MRAHGARKGRPTGALAQDGHAPGCVGQAGAFWFLAPAPPSRAKHLRLIRARTWRRAWERRSGRRRRVFPLHLVQRLCFRQRARTTEWVRRPQAVIPGVLSESARRTSLAPGSPCQSPDSAADLASAPGRRSRLVAPHAGEFNRPVLELQVAYGRWRLGVQAGQAALPRRLVAVGRVVVVVGVAVGG